MSDELLADMMYMYDVDAPIIFPFSEGSVYVRKI